jgi:mannosyltransferase OCH1-like enzyme
MDQVNVTQIYLSDDEQPLPPILHARSESIRKLFINVNEYKLYTNSSLRQFISENYPERILRAYDKLKPYSYKADLGRFCVINKVGGWYFDIGVYGYQENLQLEFEKDLDMIVASDMQKYVFRFFSAWTGVFYSKKDNPVLQEAIDMIVENCEKNYYGHTQLDPTGPTVFGKALAIHGADLKIIYAWHTELTPDMSKKNKAFVLPNGFILCFCKNCNGGDLTELGGRGVNNYGDMWRQKNIYNE